MPTPHGFLLRWLGLTLCAVVTTTALAATFQDELTRIESLVVSADPQAGRTEADSLYARALAEFGPRSPEAARALRALAIAHEKTREFGVADSLYGEALAILRERADADTAKVRDSMGVLAARLGHYREAEAHYEAGLRGRIEAVGPDAIELVGFTNNLARIYAALGKHAEAESLYVRALEICHSAAERDTAREIQTLFGLANTCYAARKLELGARVAREAAALAERHDGPESRLLARILRIQGVIDRTAGDIDEALAAHERALAIVEKSPDAAPVDLAEVYNALASDHEVRGEYDLVRGFLTRAVDAVEAGYGPDHPQTAVPLVNLGSHLAGEGDYLEARDVFLRVLEIDEAAFGDEHPRVAEDLMNLGLVAYLGGDVENASSYLARARPIYESALTPDHESLGVFYTNLGTVIASTGNLDGGVAHLRRGLEILERTSPGTLNTATQLTELADLLLQRGDIAEARAVGERALETSLAAVGPEHPAVALAEMNIASLLAAESSYDDALAHVERAVEIYRGARGDTHPSVARALLRRAYIHHARGELAQALDDALGADRIGRAHFALLASGQSEREALRYAAYRPSGIDLAITCVVDGEGEPARTADVWDAVVRGRAGVLDEMAARRLGAAADDPAVREAVRGLRVARARLANLVVHEDDAASEIAGRMIDDAREARDDAERALAELSAPFRRQESRRDIGARDVMQALDDDDAVVAYIRYRHARDEERYAAFVRPGGADTVALVDLGIADVVDDAVRAWRGSVGRGAVPPGPLLDAAAERTNTAGIALRSLVWDPFASRVADAAHIHVVPAGTLHLVTMAALPDDAGGFLVESAPPMLRATTERDLVRSPAPANDAPIGLLAIGDPDFDAPRDALVAAARGDTGGSHGDGSNHAPMFRGTRSACTSFADLRFEPLPATGREVASVRSILSATVPDSELTLLTGPAASEEAFKRRAGERRILHVATHGFFVDGSCRSVTHVPHRAWEIGGEQRPLSAAVENPLVLSGLALTGANVREGGDEGEDGILTAEEISSLDFSRTALVVLSACDTGVGTLEGGEGVLGLSRAFTVAGAETLVLTLWAIEDDVSEEWMRGFYGELAGGRSPAAAARDASVRLLNERRREGLPAHPFYWAPFIVIG